MKLLSRSSENVSMYIDRASEKIESESRLGYPRVAVNTQLIPGKAVSALYWWFDNVSTV